MKKTSVGVADSYPLTSEAIRRALAADPSLMPLDESPVTYDGLIELVARRRPDVVVADFWLPGMDASAATRMMLKAHPGIKVIFLLGLVLPPDELRRAARSKEEGAAGFLPKSISFDELTDAIKRAARGERPVHAERLDAFLGTISERAEKADAVAEKVAGLTLQEVKVLNALSRGLLVTAVARELGISVSTVRKHVHNILEKTGAQSQTQAIAMARDHGYIRP